MQVYFTDAMTFPFEAGWRNPNEAGHAELVGVLGMADVDDRRGVLLNVQRANGKARRVEADQLWAKGKRNTERRTFPSAFSIPHSTLARGA